MAAWKVNERFERKSKVILIPLVIIGCLIALWVVNEQTKDEKELEADKKVQVQEDLSEVKQVAEPLSERVLRVCTSRGPASRKLAQAGVCPIAENTQEVIQNTQNPEAQDAEIQDPEFQSPEMQDPEIQDAEVQDREKQDREVDNPDPNDPETQDPEVGDQEINDPDPDDPEKQDPENQDPENQDPETQDPEVDDPDPNSALQFVVRNQCAPAADQDPDEYGFAWQRSQGILTLVVTCTTRLASVTP